MTLPSEKRWKTSVVCYFGSYGGLVFWDAGVSGPVELPGGDGVPFNRCLLSNSLCSLVPGWAILGRFSLVGFCFPILLRFWSLHTILSPMGVLGSEALK